MVEKSSLPPLRPVAPPEKNPAYVPESHIPPDPSSKKRALGASGLKDSPSTYLISKKAWQSIYHDSYFSVMDGVFCPGTFIKHIILVQLEQRHLLVRSSA
jgi:hypothetical protein